MQPFDAITLNAVLAEIIPILTAGRVEKIISNGNDEIIFSIYKKGQRHYLVINSHPQYAHLCLCPADSVKKITDSKTGFNQLLRKYLSSAILQDIQYEPGERIVNIQFLAHDEMKVERKLTLAHEIMGRHSNVILFDAETKQIIGACHNVNEEMSVARQIFAGHDYKLPPVNYKPSIFKLSQSEFLAICKEINISDLSPAGRKAIAGKLVAAIGGLGSKQALGLVDAALSQLNMDKLDLNLFLEKCFALILQIRSGELKNPRLYEDFSGYQIYDLEHSQSPLSNNLEPNKKTSTANEIVQAYYSYLAQKNLFEREKNRLKADLEMETNKLTSKLSFLAEDLIGEERLLEAKRYGDLLLSVQESAERKDGQVFVDDLYSESVDAQGNYPKVAIAIDDRLSLVENSKRYYKEFVRLKERKNSASKQMETSKSRLEKLKSYLEQLSATKSRDDVIALRLRYKGANPASILGDKKKGKKRSLKKSFFSFISGDGFSIYVGRNRQENDQLLRKIASAQDIWLHISGLTGSHVIIRLPSTKQEPPEKTLYEAAFAACYFSKAREGGDFQVIYTPCRYVKKLGYADKPGLVSYEREKVMKVKLGEEMPESFRKALMENLKQA